MSGSKGGVFASVMLPGGGCSVPFLARLLVLLSSKSGAEKNGKSPEARGRVYTFRIVKYFRKARRVRNCGALAVNSKCGGDVRILPGKMSIKKPPDFSGGLSLHGHLAAGYVDIPGIDLA